MGPGCLVNGGHDRVQCGPRSPRATGGGAQRTPPTLWIGGCAVGRRIQGRTARSLEEPARCVLSAPPLRPAPRARRPGHPDLPERTPVSRKGGCSLVCRIRTPQSNPRQKRRSVLSRVRRRVTPPTSSLPAVKQPVRRRALQWSARSRALPTPPPASTHLPRKWTDCVAAERRSSARRRWSGSGSGSSTSSRSSSSGPHAQHKPCGTCRGAHPPGARGPGHRPSLPPRRHDHRRARPHRNALRPHRRGGRFEFLRKWRRRELNPRPQSRERWRLRA